MRKKRVSCFLYWSRDEFLPRNSYTRIEKFVFRCCQFDCIPTTIWIYCQVQFKFWATMAVNLSGMKSMRYLLICRAGLAVSVESEAASTASKLMTTSRFWNQLLRMNPHLFTHLGRRKHQRWLRIGHQMGNLILIELKRKWKLSKNLLTIMEDNITRNHMMGIFTRMILSVSILYFKMRGIKLILHHHEEVRVLTCGQQMVTLIFAFLQVKLLIILLISDRIRSTLSHHSPHTRKSNGPAPEYELDQRKRKSRTEQRGDLAIRLVEENNR